MKNFEYHVWPLDTAEYYKAKLKELNKREQTRTAKDLDVNATFKANTRELNYLLKLATAKQMEA